MRRFKRALMMCALAGTIACTQQVAGAETANLRAGAARVDITPKNVAGLTNLYGKALTGVHDPIFARALVVDNGKTIVAIVATDLVELGDTTDLRQRVAKEVGIAFDHIMITASHDHHAPRAGSVTPGAIAHAGGAATQAYSVMAYDRIVEAIKMAKAALQPAQMGIGKGVADVNVNRDEYTAKGWELGFNDDRPSDKTVWVIRFATPSGEPIAVLFNYAVHSTVLSPDYSLLSGELAGAAQRYVEARYGDKAVALWTLGPAGDQAPRVSSFGLPAKDQAVVGIDAVNAQGLIVGAEVVRVAGHITQMTSTANIAASERVFACPTKQGVHQLDDLKQAPVSALNIRLGLIRLNDIALAGVSGEVVTNIYAHLKAQSPLKDTIMVTMANDRVGYIADDASYDMPIFEVNGSPVARGCAEPSIVRGLTEMIKAGQ
jgi:neutral ceramidase